MRSFLIFFAAFFMISSQALASISMKAPVCEITGLVLEESYREEPGKGLSEGQIFTYHDLKIMVLSSAIYEQAGSEEDITACPPVDQSFTFQKRQSEGLFEEGLNGKCVKAHSEFMADGNFMSGTWLFDIEELSQDQCQSTEK